MRTGKGPRLPYWQLQSCRQENIREALTHAETPVHRLVQLFGVAHKGLEDAVARGAVDSDAITFLRLEEGIRERLRAAPPTELMQVLGALSVERIPDPGTFESDSQPQGNPLQTA